MVGNTIQGQDTKIVAYYVPKSLIDFDELTSFLRTKLPEYMIPNLFIALKEFPLSPNGKIDRKALPKPDNKRLDMGISYCAPKSALQKVLVEIWEDVLGVQPIGITDVYYLLGGDSLRNVMIFNQVEQKLKQKINITDFLALDTIDKQSNFIENTSGSLEPTKVKYLRKEGTKTPILVVQLIQSEGYNLAKQFEHYLDDGHPVLTTVPFGLDFEKIPNSIESAAIMYVDALEKISSHETFILVGYSMSGLVANAIVELLEKKGKKIPFLFLMDTYHPKMILDKFNEFSIINRLAFYGKRFLMSDRKEKREIRQYVFDMGTRELKNRINRFRSKNNRQIRTSSSKRRTRAEEHALNPQKCNFSLAVKYRPKQIHCKMGFVSAMGDKNSIHYRNFDALNSENLSLIKRDMTTDITNCQLLIMEYLCKSICK